MAHANKGTIGKGDYKGYVNNKPTKAYTTWSNMLRRCYCPKYQAKNPTYLGCEVSTEWLNFQNFAKWFYEKYKEGYHLDKDILFKDNKIYSPETCGFIPQEINKLFTKRTLDRGKNPIGVHYDNRNKKYIAQLSKGSGKRITLGNFIDPIQAYNAYKIEKEKHIKETAEAFKNLLPKGYYEALMSYKVDITD